MVRSPKIDRWSSRSHIRERTLQDQRSHLWDGSTVSEHIVLSSNVLSPSLCLLSHQGDYGVFKASIIPVITQLRGTF